MTRTKISGPVGVRQALKQRTWAGHTAVESVLAYLEPDLTIAGLADKSSRLYGFWTANEPGIERWGRISRTLAADLQVPRRTRTALFAQDLVGLGYTDSAVQLMATPPSVFGEVLTDAEALGWFYVAEGSTLGGVILSRRLEPLLSREDITLGSFTPYAEGPGPMWHSYLAVLETWASSNQERAEAVVTAAIAVFDSLHAWLITTGPASTA